MRHFLVFSFCVLLILGRDALAQDTVGLRSGQHEGYSRLVFDWDRQVSYKVETDQSGKLVVRFEKNAGVNDAALREKTVNNILGLQTLSTSPLVVSVDIPAESKTRSFFAGSRLVVDIYDPPGGPVKPQKTALAAPEPQKPAPPVEKKSPVLLDPPSAAKKKKEPEPVQEVVEKLPEKPEESKAKEPVQAKEVDKVEAVPPQEAKMPGQEELEALAATEEAVKVNEVVPPARPTLITVSSTRSMGMAVFEMDNALWLVNDQENLMLSPQASGPDADHFLPFQEVGVTGGTAYKTKTLEGAIVRGEGGGLLWRVIVSAQERKGKPVKPFREGVQEGLARSGTITWPLKEPGKVLNMPDPVTGLTLKVVTVETSEDFSEAQKFVDFETLSAPVGLVIRPHVDDLEVEITDNGVVVSRPGGLAISSEDSVIKARSRKEMVTIEGGVKTVSKRIYDFKSWQMGGLPALAQNRNIILGGMHELNDGGKMEGLITLAKMYLSNGHGAEALGFLGFAEAEVPELADHPEFIALNAAAKAIDWKSEPAFIDLSAEILEEYEEIGYWQAYVLADLGDWQQARDVMPDNLDTLYEYPPLILHRLALVLAEVALRAGDVEIGQELLEVVEQNEAVLNESQHAALNYLKGEASRQNGDVKATKEFWEPLTIGLDDLYRVKAGLAITRLKVDEKEINDKKAIDNLERLRYAWRGDQLEAQVNYWLGKAYFEEGDHAKGLTIMRESASFATGTELGRRITSEMADAFADLFIGPGLKDVSALDAAALYDQFAELVPPGERGDKVVQMLAERMVEADLLDRAAELLSHQLEHRLTGYEAYQVAVRLAAIYLLNEKSSQALQALNRATSILQGLPEELQTQDRYLEISLLRGRALSRGSRPDQALALLGDLESNPDVNRLRADIAWNAGYWDDAAEALQDVILDENISLTRPLKPEQATLILHRVVALNLASDRIALANMREKYTDAMMQTEQARQFEVVTRPRQSAALADRDTLLSIVSEVDLFSDFLNSYKASQAPSN